MLPPNTLLSHIVCLECGHRMTADPHQRQCSQCGGTWMDAQYRYDALPTDWPEQLRARPTTLWRYGELLPLGNTTPTITLGEGWTPLTRAGRLAEELALEQLWIKDERQQPTGSFKDRQAALAVLALRARGVDEMVLASTGNAAAAYAAFCARAGVKLWVFLTSSVPAEKMRELALYGAEVVKITGTYDQAKVLAANFAARRGLHVDGGAKAIPGKESMKTIAYEIVEQLDWQAPDWYVQAVSGGIGPLGVYKGFVELFQAGLIDRVPKLGIVQVEGCAPMVHAWEHRQAEATPVQPDTLITVLATGDPGFAYHLLKEAVDRHGGAMVSVNDGAAFRAMRRLARTEGLSAEPAASVAFAGLERLQELGHIQPHERVVVNCSGHTFSAEKHALEDRYILHLETEMRGPEGEARNQPAHREGLAAALNQLDEQVTTIVVIDDNPHDSRLVRRLLQSYKNYRVFEAHNAADGIDLVRQRQPDLVMLDLTLPDRDGFAILEVLKADGRTSAIPVMIVSAKSLSLAELQHLRRHARSIWQKGNFNAQDLLQHVVEALGQEPAEANPLPAAPALPTPLPPNTMPWADGENSAQRPRILVVDDNMMDARLLRRLLEARQRFEVVEAHSYDEALRTLDDAAPDLIVLDLVLPERSGEELVEALRRREDTYMVPIIIVSAKSLDGSRRALLANRVASIWEKGVMDRNSLLAHIETILAG